MNQQNKQNHFCLSSFLSIYTAGQHGNLMHEAAVAKQQHGSGAVQL